MKLFTVLLAFLASAFISNAQTIIEVKSNDDPNKAYSKVEVQAAFPGGDSAWRIFLKQNLKHKLPGKKGAETGTYTVIVKFIVSKDGSVADVSCENDPGYGMCQEAVRLIKLSKKWVPGKQAGIDVNSYHREPIKFIVE